MKARTWVATLSGASLAVTTALLVAGSATSANASGTVGTGSAVPSPSSGRVILATNWDTSGNGFIFYVPSGTTPPTWGATAASPIVTQALTTTSNNGCIMANPVVQPTTNVTGNILNFTSAGPKPTSSTQVGYQPGSNGGSIGVSSKGGNATSCTQVNQKEGESLTINLGGGIPNSGTSPTVAIDASFDMEMKGNAIVTATTSAGEVFTLYSGLSQTKNPDGKTTNKNANCNVSVVSDSGPDAGSGDNCQWSFTATTPFTSVTLSTTQPAGAAFSVEGGGDWTNTSGTTPAAHETHFDVIANAQGVLNCGGKDSASAGTTQLTVVRAQNGATACALIPYDLGADTGTGTFHKDLSSQTDAQFGVTFTSVVPATSQTIAGYPGFTTNVATNPISALKIDWEDSAYTGGADTVDTLTFCPAGLYISTDSSGVPSFDYTKVPGDLSPAPNKQYACIYNESRAVQSDGSVLVTDQFYLTGDMIVRYS